MELAREAVTCQRLVELGEVGADDGLQIGVQRRGGAAFEFADFRQDLAGAGNVAIRPDRHRRRQSRLFIGRIGVGIDEDNRQGLRPRIAQAGCHCADLFRVDRRANAAIGQGAFGHFHPHVALDHGDEIAGQPPGVAAITPAHFQRVAKAGRGDQADAGAFAFEQRIGAHRGAVHDGAEIGHRPELPQAFQKPHRLIAAIGRHLAGLELAGIGVEIEQIGERAADIDANHRAGGHAVSPEVKP